MKRDTDPYINVNEQVCKNDTIRFARTKANDISSLDCFPSWLSENNYLSQCTVSSNAKLSPKIS